MYGATHNQLAGNDKVKIPPLPSTSHPWKVTRSGNTINFAPGLVQGQLFGVSTSFIVTDLGGYQYTPTTEGGNPVYLYLEIDVAAGNAGFDVSVTDNTPPPDELITTSIYKPFEWACLGAKPDPSYAPPPGGEPLRYYRAGATVPRVDYEATFIPPNAGGGYAYVPICYITDTATIQLLRQNVTVGLSGAHRNLFLWP
jgi:hypothetical protein